MVQEDPKMLKFISLIFSQIKKMKLMGDRAHIEMLTATDASNGMEIC